MSERIVWSATSISVWQQAKLSQQIHPWDTLACCWNAKQATTNHHHYPPPLPASPRCAYILQFQLGDAGQVWVQDADEEGHGGSAHVQHVRRQQGDVDMLPVKGVQQRHQGMDGLGQGTAIDGTATIC